MGAAETTTRSGVGGRYARQELISWWEQSRLQSARILVVGAGALGNEVVKNLVLLGVGSIVIVDFDRVELSNLARCTMFRAADDGREKAPLLAARARELNPELEIRGIHGDVRHDIGLGAFIDADVVIGALDNREARLHLNSACWKTTTPWVDGAIEGLMGVMRVFVPPDSACYESTMSAEDHALIDRRRACTLLSKEELESGHVPTTATSASVIAGLQAQEAVKLLHSDVLESDFAGRGFVFNGLTHDSYVVDYPVREDALSRDTYELDRLEIVGGNPTFGDLLAEATGLLGPEARLQLEREVVRSFGCARCERSEDVLRPVTALSAGAAICGHCGSERTLDLLHTIGTGDSQLMAMTPSDLGLPPADVVTVVAGAERRFILVDPERSPFS